MKLVTRGALIRLCVLAFVLLLAGVAGWWTMIRMPGERLAGALPAATAAEKTLAASLRRDVERLTAFGPRNVVNQVALQRAAGWLDEELSRHGYAVERQRYRIDGWSYDNVIVELPGNDRREEIVVIGAHYDTAEDLQMRGTVGANDNASGIAATLALARALAGARPSRTLRFAAFVNEELPSFWTENQGSLVYARRARARGERIVAMISLETIGYYSDEPGSQKYPPGLNLLYPDTGNFIAFVGNVSSRALVRQAIDAFRTVATIPSEGVAAPASVPGIGWSDHWSFWQVGYPAIMVTDTAPFRYPHYHTPADTADKLDYERMARVVIGIESTAKALAGID